MEKLLYKALLAACHIVPFGLAACGGYIMCGAENVFVAIIGLLAIGGAWILRWEFIEADEMEREFKMRANEKGNKGQ